MKYAVVKIGGKQYFAEEGEQLTVDKLPYKEGEKIDLAEILLLVDNRKVTLGQPLLQKTKIIVKVVKHFKGGKIRVAKFKAKTGYRRVKGFRPHLTSVKVEKIS